MQPLQIIKHALNSTISLIKKGENPSNALEKVAKEMDLNPNFIQRTGEALNVALTYGHFKTAADKAVDFDIADIPTITASIFGEKEKTSQQKNAEWFPSVVEDIDYNKLLTHPGFKKIASEIKQNTENYDSYQTSQKGQMKKAQDYLSRLEKELDHIKTEKAANDVYIEGSFFSLVNSFKKEAAARTPFYAFESQAFAEYGEKAMPYVDYIYKVAELTEDRGTRSDKYFNYTLCKEAELLGSFLKAASEKVKLAAELEEAEEFVDSQKNQYKQACYNLNPMALAFDKLACEKLSEDIDFFTKEAAESSLLQDLWGHFKGSATGEDKKSPVFKNTNLDNRERMMILQELIMTDPILSKQDPHKIIAAYQQILRLAPHLSKEKDVVRAKLREMMAGQALHPTDANQLVEANTNMMKQHQLLHQTEGGPDNKGKR